MTALSVSISTSTSPTATWSPGCLCQVATAPSVIVSDRRGILISIMPLLLSRLRYSRGERRGAVADRVQGLADGGDDVVAGRQRRRLQRLRVRHGHLGHRHPAGPR